MPAYIPAGTRRRIAVQLTMLATHYRLGLECEFVHFRGDFDGTSFDVEGLRQSRA